MFDNRKEADKLVLTVFGHTVETTSSIKCLKTLKVKFQKPAKVAAEKIITTTTLIQLMWM